MPDDDRPLGEMLGELASLALRYAKQMAAETVQEVLMVPLRRAAVSALLMGVALALAVMAVVCLSLALFHSLTSVLGGPCPAWAVTGVVCLLAGGVCVWVVHKGGRHASPTTAAPGDRRRPKSAVGPDSAPCQSGDEPAGSDPGPG